MNENKHLTPVWIIYVDGKRLDVEHEGALRSITVKDVLNGISEFYIVFDTAEVKVREKGLFSFESEISIHLGYKDDVEEAFRGEVLGFRGIYPENGVEQLEVRGSSVLHKLEHGMRYLSYENKTPSEIIKGILESYSLKAEVDDINVAHEFQSEENMTDYEYLTEQARSHGKQLYADGLTIYVKDEITAHTDEIIYEWGKSLKSFDAAQDISGLISKAEYIGWDSLKNESFAGSSELGDIAVKIGGDNDWSAVSKGGGGKSVETHIDMNCKDADEAKKLSAGLLQNNSYLFGYAHGKGEGNYKLRPGMRVVIKAVGEMFEGEYMCETVTHLFDRKNGYSSEFTLKRNMCP
jgi:phage protein D